MSEISHSLMSTRERITIPILTAILGGAAVYAYEHRIDSGQPKPSLTPTEILEHTTPCAPDPLTFEFDGKRQVIADSRCRSNGDQTVNLNLAPNESTLGPLAIVRDGTPLEVICVSKGGKATDAKRQYEDDTWVRVKASTVEGVVFRSARDEGFISVLDAVADSKLPVCDKDKEASATI